MALHPQQGCRHTPCPSPPQQPSRAGWAHLAALRYMSRSQSLTPGIHTSSSCCVTVSPSGEGNGCSSGSLACKRRSHTHGTCSATAGHTGSAFWATAQLGGGGCSDNRGEGICSKFQSWEDAEASSPNPFPTSSIPSPEGQ